MQKMLPERNMGEQVESKPLPSANPLAWYEMNEHSVPFWPWHDVVEPTCDYRGLHLLNVALLEGSLRMKTYCIEKQLDASRLHPILFWLMPESITPSRLGSLAEALRTVGYLTRANRIEKTLSWHEIGNMNHYVFAKPEPPCRLHIIQTPRQTGLHLRWVYDLVARNNLDHEEVAKRRLRKFMHLPDYDNELMAGSILISCGPKGTSIENFVAAERERTAYYIACGYLRAFSPGRSNKLKIDDLGVVVAGHYGAAKALDPYSYFNYQPTLVVHSASELYRSAYYAGILPEEALLRLCPPSLYSTNHYSLGESSVSKLQKALRLVSNMHKSDVHKVVESPRARVIERIVLLPSHITLDKQRGVLRHSSLSLGISRGGMSSLKLAFLSGGTFYAYSPYAPDEMEKDLSESVVQHPYDIVDRLRRAPAPQQSATPPSVLNEREIFVIEMYSNPPCIVNLVHYRPEEEIGTRARISFSGAGPNFQRWGKAKAKVSSNTSMTAPNSGLPGAQEHGISFRCADAKQLALLLFLTGVGARIPYQRFEKNEDVECECAICLSVLQVGTTVAKTGCEHRFCKRCLGRWLRIQRQKVRGPSCPLCGPLTANNIPVLDGDKRAQAAKRYPYCYLEESVIDVWELLNS